MAKTILEQIDDIQRLRIQILEEEQLKPRDSINYQTLRFLANKYQVNEKILGLYVFGFTNNQYKNIKNHPERKSTILIPKIPDDIEIKKKEILEAEKLKIADKINYEKLRELADKYQMDELILAINVLGLARYQYDNIRKEPSQYATILIQEITKEQIDAMRNKISENYDITNINYNLLLKLSDVYKIEEYFLATQILGYSRVQYRGMKKEPTKYKKVLKDKHISDEEEKENATIREKILKEEGLSPRDRINYVKLQQIATDHNIDEKKLALQIFLLTKSQYDNIRNKPDKNAIILKGRKLLEEEIAPFRIMIFEEEGIKAGDRINYVRLKGISNKYSIDELVLALQILGLNYSQYQSIKSMPDKNAIILKEGLIENARNHKDYILGEENLNQGDQIDYKKLKQLAKEYGIPERILALEVLEMTNSQLGLIRFGVDATILRGINPETKEKCQILNDLFSLPENEGKYHNREEIIAICEKIGISIEDFITYVVQNRFVVNPEDYIEVLEKNSKGIYIGNPSPLSNQFYENNEKDIKIKMKATVGKFCNKHTCKQNFEEYLDASCFYIFCRCGDLERNFADVNLENFWKISRARVKLFLMKEHYTHNRDISITGSQTWKKSGKERDITVVSTDKSLEPEAVLEDKETKKQIEKLGDISNSTVMSVILFHMNEGCSREDAILSASEDLAVSQEYILSVMEEVKQQMIVKGNVRQTKGGKVILGRSLGEDD